MKRSFQPLFAKAGEIPRTNPEGASAEKSVAPEGDGFRSLPDSLGDVPRGNPVEIRFPGSSDVVRALLDPIYGWMDHNGVQLSKAVAPVSWRLPQG
ncbi:MAG: hypothetical protein EOP85_09595 [Verrucomicrobiaceae bacterium]|nr:MAG: hypothetical protein EOP85_09595 [Verrucomicrobiaceae bacterium]